MEVISTDDYPSTWLSCKEESSGANFLGEEVESGQGMGGINSKAYAGWRDPAKRERWVGQEREERPRSNV